ncbi:MAG: PHP domain-containing protein, partial [Omnitrophica bacterium]|nr:PHP domain-containing protein [Candidatus Omnitrophota bacterium]
MPKDVAPVARESLAAAVGTTDDVYARTRDFVVRRTPAFNYREYFIRYLTEKIIEGNMDNAQAEAFIDKNILFWRFVLVDQESPWFQGGKLGKMRERRMPIRGGRFVITDFEMDKLFEYCHEDGTDPVAHFGLGDLIDNDVLGGLNAQDRSKKIQELIDKGITSSEQSLQTSSTRKNTGVKLQRKQGFRAYLSKKRKQKGIPEIKYPMSDTHYHALYLPMMFWAIFVSSHVSRKSPLYKMRYTFLLVTGIITTLLIKGFSPLLVAAGVLATVLGILTFISLWILRPFASESSFGNRLDREVSPQERAMMKLASRFWAWSFLEWEIYNGLIILLITIVLPAMAIPIWAKYVCAIPFILNAILSFTSILHANIASLSDYIRGKYNLDETNNVKTRYKILGIAGVVLGSIAGWKVLGVVGIVLFPIGLIALMALLRHYIFTQTRTALNKLKKDILPNDPKFRLVWRSFVRNLYNNSFRFPLISRKTYERLMDLENQRGVPGIDTAWARQSIVDLVNFYYSKKPDLKQITPLALMINATGADTWRTGFDALDKRNKDAGEMVTLWDKLMEKHGKEFDLFADNLAVILGFEEQIQTSSARKATTVVTPSVKIDKSSPQNALNSLKLRYPQLSEDQVKSAIEDWANWRLGTVYKTFESIRTSAVWSYAMAAHRLGVLSQNSGETEAVYERRLEDWAKKQVTIILKYASARIGNYFTEMSSRPEEQGHSWTVLEGGREPQFWADLEAGNQRWPYVLLVGSPAFWLPENSLQSGMAWKVSNYQYTRAFIRTRDDSAPSGSRSTPYLFGLDTGHRIDYEDFLYLPDNLMRFKENPRLALLGSTYKVFEHDYTIEATACGMSELVFNSTVRRAGARVFGEPGVGKMVIDVEKADEAAAMLGYSIIEDTDTTNRLQTIGYTTEHTDTVVTKQNTYNTIYEAFSFITRFGGPTSKDTALSPAGWEFWLSRNVHWTVKLGLLVGLWWHYIKKKLVKLTNEAMFLLVVLLPFSLYAEFWPWILFAYIGGVFAQAINFHTKQWFIQKYGYALGTILFIILFPVLYLYYVAFVPEHDNQTSNFATRGCVVMTIGTRDSNLNRRGTVDIFHRWQATIRLGTFLIWVVVLGAAFHPVGWAINALLMLAPICWVVAPYLFNPAKSIPRSLGPLERIPYLASFLKKAPYKLYLTFTGSIYGFVRATLELMILAPLAFALAKYAVLPLLALAGITFSGWQLPLILGFVALRLAWSLFKEGLLEFSHISQCLFNRGDFVWNLDNFFKGFTALSDFLSHKLMFSVYKMSPISLIVSLGVLTAISIPLVKLGAIVLGIAVTWKMVGIISASLAVLIWGIMKVRSLGTPKDYFREHIKRDIAGYLDNDGIPSLMRRMFKGIRNIFFIKINLFFLMHGSSLAQKFGDLLKDGLSDDEEKTAIDTIYNDAKLANIREDLVDFTGDEGATKTYVYKILKKKSDQAGTVQTSSTRKSSTLQTSSTRKKTTQISKKREYSYISANRRLVLEYKHIYKGIINWIASTEYIDLLTGNFAIFSIFSIMFGLILLIAGIGHSIPIMYLITPLVMILGPFVIIGTYYLIIGIVSAFVLLICLFTRGLTPENYYIGDEVRRAIRRRRISIQELIEVLQDRIAISDVVVALGNEGPLAKDAILTLEELLANTNPTVQEEIEVETGEIVEEYEQVGDGVYYQDNLPTGRMIPEMRKEIIDVPNPSYVAIEEAIVKIKGDELQTSSTRKQPGNIESLEQLRAKLKQYSVEHLVGRYEETFTKTNNRELLEALFAAEVRIFDAEVETAKEQANAIVEGIRSMGRVWNVEFPTTGELLESLVPAVVPTFVSSYKIIDEKEWIEFLNSLTPENYKQKLAELGKEGLQTSSTRKAQALTALAQSTQSLQWIHTWDRVFDGFNPQDSDVETVTIAFDRGNKGNIRYQIPIPIYNRLSDIQKDTVVKYVTDSIHGYTHFIGIEGILIHGPPGLIEKTKAIYNPDRAAKAPYGWLLRVLKKAYSLETDAAPLNAATLEEIAQLSQDTTRPSKRRDNLNKGVHAVIDIGGSDIKFGIKEDGQGKLLFYKEYSWSPESIFDPFSPFTQDQAVPTGHVPTLKILIDLSRLRLGLENLRRYDNANYTQSLNELNQRIDATIAKFQDKDQDKERAETPLPVLHQIVEDARIQESETGLKLFVDINGIGLSVNLACVDNKVVGFGHLIMGILNPEGATITRFAEQGQIDLKDVAKGQREQHLLDNLDETLRPRFETAITAAKEVARRDDLNQRLKAVEDLGQHITEDISAEAAVFNDGDALAFYVAAEENGSRYFVLSLGTGVASGYVDELGLVADIMGEAGAVHIDMAPNAPGIMPGENGNLRQYISQRAVIDPQGWNLAAAYDIDLAPFGDNKDAKLAHAQSLFDSDSVQDRQKAQKIFTHIGQALAVVVYRINRTLSAYAQEKPRYSLKNQPIQTVLIVGRVTRGKAGQTIVEEANKYLKEELNLDHITVVLPKETDDPKRVEVVKRFGQLEGAGYYVSQVWQDAQELQTSSTRKHSSIRKVSVDLSHPDLTGTGQRIRSAAAAVLRFGEREQEGIRDLEKIIIEEDRKRQSSQHDIDVLFGAVVSRNLLGQSDNPVVQAYQRDLSWLPDNKGRRDLHVHTSMSDGDRSIEEVIKEAVRTGTKWMAITEHNIVLGVERAVELGKKYGVNVIPGVEFESNVVVHSAQRGYLNGTNHILGLYIDYNNPQIEELCIRQHVTQQFRHLWQVVVLQQVIQEKGLAVPIPEYSALQTDNGAIDVMDVSELIFGAIELRRKALVENGFIQKAAKAEAAASELRDGTSNKLKDEYLLPLRQLFREASQSQGQYQLSDEQNELLETIFKYAHLQVAWNARKHLAYNVLKDQPDLDELTQEIMYFFAAEERSSVAYESAETVVETIDAAGGVAVYAHPGWYFANLFRELDLDATFDKIAALIRRIHANTQGKLKAVEVYYPYQDRLKGVDDFAQEGSESAKVRYFRELTEELGLFATGGTDWHSGEKHLPENKRFENMGTGRNYNFNPSYETVLNVQQAASGFQTSSTRKARLPDRPLQTSSTRKASSYLSLTDRALTELLALQGRIANYDKLPQRSRRALLGAYEFTQARAPPLAKSVYDYFISP